MCTINDIETVNISESKSSAIKLLKPWIDQHVVTVKDGRKKQFCLSGVFRECLSSLQIIEGFENEGYLLFLPFLLNCINRFPKHFMILTHDRYIYIFYTVCLLYCRSIQLKRQF